MDRALEQVFLENFLPIPCRSPVAGNLSLTSYLATVVSVAIFCIFKSLPLEETPTFSGIREEKYFQVPAAKTSVQGSKRAHLL